MKYNVGDKVRVKSYEQMAKEYKVYSDGNIHFPGSACFFKKSGMERYCGKVFTVEYIANNHPKYRLAGTDGYSWIDEMLEPANEEKIVITHDDREVTAKLYRDEKLVKAETAKCHPNDKFDFNTGAKLAFDRLMDTDVKKAVSGASCKFKIGERVCVRTVKEVDKWLNDKTGVVVLIGNPCNATLILVRFDEEDPRLHEGSLGYAYGDLIPRENTHRCWWLDEWDLRPAVVVTKPERLKVGTRVRSKHDGGVYGFLNGKTGKVIHDDGTDRLPYVVEFEDICDSRLNSGGDHGKNKQCLWCDAEQIEVVDDFLEGDRVKIVERGYVHGKMGTVVCKISGPYGCYGVEIDDYHGGHDCGPRKLKWGRRSKYDAGRWLNRIDLELVTKDDLKPEKGETKAEEKTIFKVGDRIEVLDSYSFEWVRGKRGTIVEVDERGVVAVEMDEKYDSGHSCCGLTKDGFGRWFSSSESRDHLKKLTGWNGKAVFTGKGAFGLFMNDSHFTVGKVYEFKDGYTTDDRGRKKPEIGAVIDFDKSSFILGDFEKYVEPEFYNGKVVCVKHPNKLGFTVGKVYEFVDGRIIDDDGDRRPCCGPRIKDLNDDYLRGCFIPYVE